MTHSSQATWPRDGSRDSLQYSGLSACLSMFSGTTIATGPVEMFSSQGTHWLPVSSARSRSSTGPPCSCLQDNQAPQNARIRYHCGSPNATRNAYGIEEVGMKRILVISGTVAAFMLSLCVQLPAQQPGSAPAKQTGKNLKATRDIKLISSAGARAMADACTAWAEQNKQTVAMAILDWG